MIRSLDPAPFNDLANHPSVRPWIGGGGPLELAPIIANPRNYCFLTDDARGAFMYVGAGPATYDVHCMSRLTRQMAEARRQSLAYMFETAEAEEILAMVPDGNRGSDRLARCSGFEEFDRREMILNVGGFMVGVSYRRLTRQAWLERREGSA